MTKREDELTTMLRYDLAVPLMHLICKFSCDYKLSNTEMVDLLVTLMNSRNFKNTFPIKGDK